MADQRLNNTLDEVIVSKGSVGLYRGANGTLTDYEIKVDCRSEFTKLTFLALVPRRSKIDNNVALTRVCVFIY